jgi:hypothetical protein
VLKDTTAVLFYCNCLWLLFSFSIGDMLLQGTCSIYEFVVFFNFSLVRYAVLNIYVFVGAAAPCFAVAESKLKEIALCG